MVYVQMIIGGAVTMGVILPSVPIAIIQRQASSSLHASQLKQETKDLMIMDINTIAWKQYEYRLLPKEFNGGAGSLAGFTVPKDLMMNETTYEVTVKDSTLEIHASSSRFAHGSITATVNTGGKFLCWNFQGCFE